jgi:Uma2 family endonuclease
MATTAALMTVEEFSKLPKDDGPFYHELHRGQVVAVSRPIPRYYLVQTRLRDLLQAIARPGSFTATVLAFCPTGDRDLRVADVAYISPERNAAWDLDNYFQGAPDLVAEVLSPSNTASEIYDKQVLCLDNGARQFWVIDPEKRRILVFTPDGTMSRYEAGQQIPVPMIGQGSVSVDAILG